MQHTLEHYVEKELRTLLSGGVYRPPRQLLVPGSHPTPYQAAQREPIWTKRILSVRQPSPPKPLRSRSQHLLGMIRAEEAMNRPLHEKPLQATSAPMRPRLMTPRSVYSGSAVRGRMLIDEKEAPGVLYQQASTQSNQYLQAKMAHRQQQNGQVARGRGSH